MKTEEILGSVKNLVLDISASKTGCLDLIDEIYFDNTEAVRADCARMQNDREYYVACGGWDNWIKRQNENTLNKYAEIIKNNGYEIESIDFYDEHNCTLFLNVKKTEA